MFQSLGCQKPFLYVADDTAFFQIFAESGFVSSPGHVRYGGVQIFFCNFQPFLESQGKQETVGLGLLCGLLMGFVLYGCQLTADL